MERKDVDIVINGDTAIEKKERNKKIHIKGPLYDEKQKERRIGRRRRRLCER